MVNDAVGLPLPQELDHDSEDRPSGPAGGLNFLEPLRNLDSGSVRVRHKGGPLLLKGCSVSLSLTGYPEISEILDHACESLLNNDSHPNLQRGMCNPSVLSP